MDPRNCAHCGASFNPRNRAQRFCKRACRQASQAGRRRGPLADRSCELCGATYSPVRDNQRYCCQQCAGRAGYLRRRPEDECTTATCEHCGQAFDYIRKGRPRLYCSSACRQSSKNARSRRRKRQARAAAEPGRGPQVASSFPRGSLSGAPLPLSDWDTEPYCGICGRPADEGFGQWRLHALRTSPRAYEMRVPICPLHAGTSTRLIDEILRMSLRPGHSRDWGAHGEP